MISAPPLAFGNTFNEAMLHHSSRANILAEFTSNEFNRMKMLTGVNGWGGDAGQPAFNYAARRLFAVDHECSELTQRISTYRVTVCVTRW